MKRRDLYIITIFSSLLLVLGIYYLRGAINTTFEKEVGERSFFDIFEKDQEQKTYPNPELIDKTGGIGADETSTSTAHVTSYSPVAGAPATATSTPAALRVPVMIYHSVRPHTPESAQQDAYDITPELLEQEILYLKAHGYTTVKFSDLEAAFDEGKPLPPKPVILSFDDGWENQYTYAFPVLKKHGVVGTFYIYTNPISRNKHWMTWSQVTDLDKAGMEIGGHSRTHPYLTKIVDNKLLDKEVVQAKEIIEAHIGHPITTFAYPFGYYNARVVAAVKRAGYTSARNVFKGVWQDATHRLELRGALSTDNIKDFEKYIEMN
jgi:peptidoglycan/xylan/chitin deacetylase (PgdA/CDA1 family)